MAKIMTMIPHLDKLVFLTEEEYESLELMIRTLRNSAIKTDNPLKKPLNTLYETFIGCKNNDNDSPKDQEAS